MEDIESVTPQFISTAGQVAEDQPEDEKLYLLSHQWATAVCLIIINYNNNKLILPFLLIRLVH